MITANIIGYSTSGESGQLLRARGTVSGQELSGAFHVVTGEEIRRAAQLATDAFREYQHFSGKQKAIFLRAIADRIDGLGDSLVSRAMAETGLPEGRIKGERGRTVGQLRMFANYAEEGSWVEAIIDQADADRTPVPKPDVRRMLVPLGPVVVFTASNFPLAFSTAGGDTASALASGCPVIVKSHEGHLGTNALVAEAIQQAAVETGMPDGVFSSLNGLGTEIGSELIMNEHIKAIAFTGSQGAGLSIYQLAHSRKTPIPVFAEMGSVNPVIVLPGAITTSDQKWSEKLAQSLTLSAGQFCTNPGLIFGLEGPELEKFIEKLTQALDLIPEQTMLNEKVYRNFLSRRKEVCGILTDQLPEVNSTLGFEVKGRIASIDGKSFLDNPKLHEEVFGPFGLIVKCNSMNELLLIVEKLSGQLTGTVLGMPYELKVYQKLLDLLQAKVGRIIYNGVPTGVEVNYSMHHGGPYPATSDSRFTSVGVHAIKRFVRPIAFQDWPDDILPQALQAANPLKIIRTLNGQVKLPNR